MQSGDKVLWRSFKIMDRWYEGTLIAIVRKRHFDEYHIRTTKPGIHAVVVRYLPDIKPNF